MTPSNGLGTGGGPSSYGYGNWFSGLIRKAVLVGNVFRKSRERLFKKSSDPKPGKPGRNAIFRREEG